MLSSVNSSWESVDWAQYVCLEAHLLATLYFTLQFLQIDESPDPKDTKFRFIQEHIDLLSFEATLYEIPDYNHIKIQLQTCLTAE